MRPANKSKPPISETALATLEINGNPELPACGLASELSPPADPAPHPPTAETPRPHLPEISAVSIDVPLAKLPPATWSLYVDTRLSPEQSNALRSLACALEQQKATLASGAPVNKPATAIRWLLEQIGSKTGHPAASVE